MNSLDLYIAKVQARLAFCLIAILVLLTFGVGAMLLLPHVAINQEISGLLIQVVTGVLALAGSAIAFFFARHRPPTAGDNDAGIRPPLVPSPPANPANPSTEIKP